ncbi:TRIO and F-actin-binding protein [Tanacetum coccineum]
MAPQDKNTTSKPSLLGRLRIAVKKVTFLMNYNINRWRLASNIIGGRRGPRALSSRRRSFNERLGLTSSFSYFSHEDDHSTWTTPYMTPSTSSKMMSPEQSVGELQKTRSFPLQRTTSFPEEEDVDKKAELFIANFYRQLKMERQVSLQLRYRRDNTSFGSSPNGFSP